VTSSARASAEPPTFPEGRVDTPSMTLNGAIRVTLSAGAGMTQVQNTDGAAGAVLWDAPGELYTLQMYGLDGVGDGIVFLLDADAIPPDGGPVSPLLVQAWNAADTFFFQTLFPLRFETGIVVVVSADGDMTVLNTTGVTVFFIAAQVAAAA
jgi:hypothetical protein